MAFAVLVIKFNVTAFMILPGWVEDISPVYPPNFDPTDKSPGTAIATKDDWFDTYRIFLFYAVVSGALHAVISRISHVLTRPGGLRHESYMSIYAYLVCSMIMPVFILSNLSTQSEKRKHIEETSDFVNYTFLERVGIFTILSILLLLKNVKLERGIMKRFVEDYDSEIHFLPLPGWNRYEDDVEIHLSHEAVDQEV